MIVSLIAAHAENLVIGKDGELPWHYPEDLKHFKKRTLGCPVVMGRGVFEELNEKPLPGRENIVLTSRHFENVTVFSSIPEALDYLKDYEKVYIIGGGQIYKQTIDLADRLEITAIKKAYDGDVFFPEYRHNIGSVWKEVHRESHDEFDFIDYERL